MQETHDGPVSPHFQSIKLESTVEIEDLREMGVSDALADNLHRSPSGTCTSWGIPFEIESFVLVSADPTSVSFAPTIAQWFVILHTSDIRPLDAGPDGFISPMRGAGQLNEHAATYVLLYEDGTEARTEIRRRHQVGAFQRGWGENCFQAVTHSKPAPVRASHEQLRQGWGKTQTRADNPDGGLWMNWLWAWENPQPGKAVVGIRFEPVSGTLLVFGLAAGNAVENPLRWRQRTKALLTLPAGKAFDPVLDERGLLNQIQLDMGQVISASPRLAYPNESWTDSYNNQLPVRSEQQVLVEYTSHPDACFHLAFADRPSERVAVGGVETGSHSGPVMPVPPATQRVALRVIDASSRQPVAVKLHVHGQYDEYLAPVDRHRIVNTAWFEDYSVDFSHQDRHACTYIPGETVLDLSLGKVYIEISKGFEIRPVRRIVEVTTETEEIQIELSRVLPWREKGWVTADTHVHFLSPMSARLEGAAEGVNVVNLLASQWGELMTNVGDFDGATTWGSRETGQDGEYLVRVGTENRQHVMGHISLLGYKGQIIAPMTTGGPDESALGDPIEILLTEWARQCHKQGGLVVLPHFPNPRAEHAASIISGDIDALEMTSWGDLYSGINPYSLSDWYRYLNCGYMVPAVGGTDKMSASTAVGTVRTYTRLDEQTPFTYGAWMNAVRRGETFVTYGPLLEFSVDGLPMGRRIAMNRTGGTVEVMWQVSSVTVPMTRVELVVNGEIRESVAVDAADGIGADAAGTWSIHLDKSSWVALLVRGHYEDQCEIIAAHSSPVMIDVEGSQMLAAADAVTILEQIEGAMAYFDTIGTRADDRAYKRMRLVLESAHRSLHNRMHRLGRYHDHTPVTDHKEHH